MQRNKVTEQDHHLKLLVLMGYDKMGKNYLDILSLMKPHYNFFILEVVAEYTLLLLYLNSY